MSKAKSSTIVSVQGLAAAGLVSSTEAAALVAVEKNFSTRLTPEVLGQMDSYAPQDPIFRQYVPAMEELAFAADEISDPIGDMPHQKCKGIVHRYPDRLLLMPTHTCQVYCRFCFRRARVGQAEETLNRAELDAAIAYIASQPQVREVILSGGDPLVLSDRRIGDILRRLAAIAHIDVIRFHTRVPLVEPARITADFLKLLRLRSAVYIVLHVNHVRELTKPVRASLARMARAGIPLLSQTVLLKGVNDDATILEELFRCLVANRVKPYYLHHLDKAQGTSHFRVPIEEGQRIMRILRGRLSGLAQPTYVLDIPGGHGKVPIGPAYASGSAVDGYDIVDPQDQSHPYHD